MFSRPPRSTTRPRYALAALVALAFGLFTAVGATPVAAANSVTAVNGSAYGYRAFGISLFGGAQTDTGPTPTAALASDASNSPQTGSAVSGIVSYGPATLFTSDGITVTATGSLGTSGSSTTTTSVNNINKSTTQPTATGSE